jgi:hypothetical protein
LVFLILLIVATAVPFAWLLVVLGRLTLGDMRSPLLHPSPARHRPAPVDAPVRSNHAPPARAPAADPPPDPVLYDASDAERAVREHLYGRRT